MTYATAMEHAEGLYRDVVAAFARHDLEASVDQTGGMCLAVTVQLGANWYALVTDTEGPLPWERETLTGFMVGIYSSDDSHTGGCEGWIVDNEYRRTTDAQQLADDLAPLLKRLSR